MTKKQETWLYILFQIALVILLESIKTYRLNIFNTSISYSMFIIPFVLFVAHYICKKFGVRTALIGTFISGLVTIIFMILISFAIGKSFIIKDYIGELFAYLISQTINISFYEYILRNTKKHTIIILFNYIVALLFFHMIYTLSYLDYIELNNYWYKYIITLGIETIILVPLTIVDKKIKKGSHQN